MEKIQSIASYTKEIFDKNLHSQIVNKHLDVEAWFRKQWIKYPAPFYSSIDLRNSGYKIAPVDTNLFPAGFNNLDSGLDSLYLSAIQHALEKQSIEIERVLIISENHTRNKFYNESIKKLESLINRAGFETQTCMLGDVENVNLINKKLSNNKNVLSYKSFVPDIIILNNDLSSGVPKNT